MFTAIVFVLTSGVAWRYLPSSFGVKYQTAHRRFSEWTVAGLWPQIHRAVLDELGAAGEIDWSRAVVDAASVRAKRGISDRADYQGALLLNPGGPGGEGREEVLQSILVSEEVSAAYDWIGFDPRGVGASRPALSCDGKYTGYDRPKYVPAKPKGEKIWLRRSKDYARKCARAGGALLDNLKTTDNVKDMEILRKVLGKKQISFMGYSYGSYLGQVYATQHPDRVRRMVLDGVVDARQTWYESNLEQNRAFELNIDAFFAWVATKHSTYRLGTETAGRPMMV